MSTWEKDTNLRSKLLELVTQSYKQKEILVVIKEEFGEYDWSLRTLQRRLQHFQIKAHDNKLRSSELIEVVKKEIEGPGQLLGYRALHRKIRVEHQMLFKRDDVYLAMKLLCPERLEERRLLKYRKRFHKRTFISKGANAVWSVDGHDKLSGRNKHEFPFGVHGGIDAFSRKVLWLKVFPSNSTPALPAALYFNAVKQLGFVPQKTRSDFGTENVELITLQNFLSRATLGTRNHICGSSITNQVIEQWWRGFRERQGEFFKGIFHDITREGFYDDTNKVCRVMLAFVFTPLVQAELDSFKELWNSHRIRKQNIYRPCGIPNFLYHNPTFNGGEQCGIVPSQGRVEYVEENMIRIKEMKFVNQGLEREAIQLLNSRGITKVNLVNSKDAYLLLVDHFKTSDIDFEYY